MSASSVLEAPWVTRDAPLGPLTTYKLGGPARLLAEPEDESHLAQLAASGLANEMSVLVLGRGSNVVVADSGFAGLVVRLGRGFSYVEVQADGVLAGAVTPLPRVARAAVEAGLSGLEFFVGIPGSVGGAVRQNAGCFGRETRDVLRSATVIELRTGSIREAGPDELSMGYRRSSVRPHDIVTRALFDARAGDRLKSKEELVRITRWRRAHQPGGTLNAGSVFKNPPGAAAGEIIDRLGLKGMSVGGVSVSTKHANFFTAGPSATASDLRELVRLVAKRVQLETGIRLEPEIEFVGFEDEH